MGEIFLVHPESIWVVIPVVAIIGGFIVKMQRIKAETYRFSAGNDQVLQEMRDSILRLESRVTNLERAVTTVEAERKYAL